jgi:predicted GNAT family N-acyltransferase
MSETPWRVREAVLAVDGAAIRAIREAVFIQEQGVPAELEWDGSDAQATHLLAIEPGGQAVGTARLLPDGRLGRMAGARGRQRIARSGGRDCPQ